MSSGLNFFAALVAGLAIAAGLQLILTNLSVAAGISAVGPIRAPGDHKSTGDKEKKDEGVMKTVQSFNSYFGIWTLVTASISLFFASWLAVELSFIPRSVVGAVIGLSIWGFFYTFIMVMEAAAISSMVGTTISVARSGFRAASDATVALFKKSPEDRAADAAVKIVESVRKEIFGDIDRDDIKHAIDKYVKELDLSRFQPQNVRREIAELLNDSEINAVITHEGPLLDREKITAHLETEKGMTREKAESAVKGVEDAISKIREEASMEKDRTSKVIDAAMRIAGISSEDAAASREKIENYLRATGKEQLNPEGIKQDLERLVTDPRGGIQAMKARLSSIDKSTVTAVLEQRPDISHDEAEKIVENIDRIAHDLQGRVQETVRSSRESAVSKIHTYLDSLHREELSYEGIKQDMVRLYHDPKAGADALVRRLRSVDRDTLKAIVSSRKDISEQDAERIISRMESARDDVIDRAEKMRDEVESRLKDAEREAYHEAEEIRKTAATAAWWAFGTAVASGIAAALGGIVAVATGTPIGVLF
ncbi:MAG: hypothetical protein ACYC9O_10270 [Candidatus Latescibacterota bacterium]